MQTGNSLRKMKHSRTWAFPFVNLFMRETCRNKKSSTNRISFFSTHYVVHEQRELLPLTRKNTIGWRHEGKSISVPVEPSTDLELEVASLRFTNNFFLKPAFIQRPSYSTLEKILRLITQHSRGKWINYLVCSVSVLLLSVLIKNVFFSIKLSRVWFVVIETWMSRERRTSRNL